MKEKKVTLTSLRKAPLYNKSLLLHGNGKLLDYTDDDGNKFRYAQYNTRALKDCPFASEGCKAVCYATKGNHAFSDVKESRERSFKESLRSDFAESVVYTIETEKKSLRYKDATMIIRIHESGDFYSVQYLKKWVRIWEHFTESKNTVFVLYTKSFPFFLMLTEEEKEIVRKAQKEGTLSINLSMDDTFSNAQKVAYLNMIKTFPLSNTYYCTENVDTVKHDNVCDCANCAKCGKCNHDDGQVTVVKIHSASKKDMKVYNDNRSGK